MAGGSESILSVAATLKKVTIMLANFILRLIEGIMCNEKRRRKTESYKYHFFRRQLKQPLPTTYGLSYIDYIHYKVP